MQILFIDCEWNSFGGEFISVGLCALNGENFYRSVGCQHPHPWVAEHVIPVLGTRPVPMSQLQADLERFLNQWPHVHIIADWPEDFVHFNTLLLTGPGQRLQLPKITMEIALGLMGESAVPHNALHDAIANCKAWLDSQYKE